MSDYDFNLDPEAIREYRLRLDMQKLAVVDAHTRLAAVQLIVPVSRARKRITALGKKIAVTKTFSERLLLEHEMKLEQIAFAEMYRHVASFELRS